VYHLRSYRLTTRSDLFSQVQTEAGNELARICVIDYRSKQVVFDTHVKPAHKVKDYLTRWSGIQPGSLDAITTTLADVQAQLLPLLSPSTTASGGPDGAGTPILLGHSLESDLRALRIAHPRVLDTAVCFGHPRGRPFKPGLAWLARKWLGRAIQNRGEGGHDPEEDARACVDLLVKKVANGRLGVYKQSYLGSVSFL
jgi:RNA exonuclease 1